MIFGTIIGAIGGEIADHLPYFNRAVPEGIAYLTKQNPELFYNNLDKIGTAIGLISSAFIRYRIRLGIDTKRHEEK